MYCSETLIIWETVSTTKAKITSLKSVARPSFPATIVSTIAPVITDGKRIVYVKNGTSELASVTGTGCMLGALCSTFMTSASPMDATISACCYFGICGELSSTKNGNGSFMANLIDKISTLGREEIFKHLNMEEKQ